MMNLSTQTTIKHALDALAQQDADVKDAIAWIGYPKPRTRDGGFGTLARIVLAQQISTRVADTLEERVLAMSGGWDAAIFSRYDIATLRSCGLSGRKAEYIHNLACQITAGTFVPEDLSALDDVQAITKIMALRGFGRWSAEIYCMFSLGRTDMMPADDIALQQAFANLKGLEKRPDAKSLRKMTQDWAPYRSAGALFLWHYYHGRPA
ncbi:MAG: DNA-3-methyladenine glycosylase 2 family protein [Pseudomonadota bacterium]